MRKTILWTTLMSVVAGAAWAEQPVNANRAVTPGASISIENVAGSLTITGSDGSEVRVTGIMGDDVEELEITGDRGELSIEVVIPEDDNWQGERKIAADLEVQVPRDAALDIETVSAAIDIRGVSGEIEAGSVSGAVSVAGGGSDIEVESVSGSVSVSGALRTRTSPKMKTFHYCFLVCTN